MLRLQSHVYYANFPSFTKSKMIELHDHLQSNFGITKESLDQVAVLFQESQLKKGAYFTRKEQFCEKLSFVKEGYIRIFSNTEKKEVTQWISTKGQFVTDLYAFVFKQRARWNIQALTDCQLYTIQNENYEQLNSLVPNWHQLEKQFIAGCFVTLEDRVFNHLSLNAEERYDQLFEQNKALFNQVPHQYLASMLGMTPETFSRIRNKKNS